MGFLVNSNHTQRIRMRPFLATPVNARTTRQAFRNRNYRGFKHFQGAIGLGVFAHNLIVLANLGMT
jgi:hypothetical protein